MDRKRHGTTKYEIAQTALHCFLEDGYAKTTVHKVATALHISEGAVIYNFPTKEHMLAVLIEMLADYQWEVFQNAVDEGETPITALCFELIAMATMCEENEIARELYISAYTSELSLAIIRKTDCMRAKKVFAEFCPDWTEEQFVGAEMLVSGIEYATLRMTPDSLPLEQRFARAMDAILQIYGVPEERRKMKIQKALSMDYRKYSQHILEDFKKYVEDTIERNFEEFKRVHNHFNLKYVEG